MAGLLADIHLEKKRARRRADLSGHHRLRRSGVADSLHVPFVQEVIAETEAIDKEYPQADVIIELGGEDAKITYLKPTPGTAYERFMRRRYRRAFIDQMSTLA